LTVASDTLGSFKEGGDYFEYGALYFVRWAVASITGWLLLLVFNPGKHPFRGTPI
jgi:hypothetical protein